MPIIRILAIIASIAAYLLIVLGGIVRITGSGMGCGDEWPLCNGSLIPPLNDMATFIEYSHRLLAAGVSIGVSALTVTTIVNRKKPGFGGRGGVTRPAILAATLLVVQIFLGAITVWLELPPASVVLHLSAAMAILAVLMITAFRARPGNRVQPDARLWRSSVAATGLGAAALLLGALTANTGAAGACLGFPLCSGQVWPTGEGSGLAHVHWTHRLIAYGLVLHLFGMVMASRARQALPAVRNVILLALGITAAQIVVGALMVLSILQPHWRATHVAAGTAVWMTLVALAWYTRPGSRPQDG